MKYDVEIAIQILEDAEAKPFDHAVVNGGMRNPFYKINNLFCSKKKFVKIFETSLHAYVRIFFGFCAFCF